MGMTLANIYHAEGKKYRMHVGCLPLYMEILNIILVKCQLRTSYSDERDTVDR
jgi:hypothetical protein